MRTSPFSFTLARQSDIEETTSFLLQGFEQEWGDNPDFPKPDKTSVMAEISSLVEVQGLTLYKNNNVICGVIGVRVCKPFWWSSKECLQGVIFYIKPEFRGFNSYNRMLSIVEEFARINQVPLEMSFFGTDLDRKTKALLHRGYKPVSWSVYRNEKQVPKNNYNHQSSRT